MITEIEMANYKSIDKLTLSLGRLNVFIGENGAGKSNILEVIALAGAAAADKLDNEFLASRGIRVTKPEHMRAAFPGSLASNPISISLKNNDAKIASLELSNENLPYSKWAAKFTGIINLDKSPTLSDAITLEKKEDGNLYQVDDDRTFLEAVIQKLAIHRNPDMRELANFVIYAPENTSLRKFDREGQIEPLGINGEGLLKLLLLYSQSEEPRTLIEIKSSLQLLDWFEDFNTLDHAGDSGLEIKDRFLDKNVRNFDHRSTNEGFFFLLFYFALFSSDLTPKFFAVDNIDASLNPKLCQKLVVELVKLAKKNNKQTILTTHNPAVLDGLNLDDDEQRLFVISRGRSGATKIKRIKKPVSSDGAHPYRLSELFIRGVLGGLPKGF